MSSLRNRRRRETSDTIHRMAIELAYKYGLENVTTDMISEAAGISPRTFFNYFPFKEAALAPQKSELSEAEIAIFISSDLPLIDAFIVLLLPGFEKMGSDSELMRKAFEVSQTSPKLQALESNMFQHFEEMAGKLLAMRLNRKNDDPDVLHLAAILFASIRVGISIWARTSKGTAMENVAARLHAIRPIFDTA